MNCLTAIGALLMTACSLHAGFAGFEVGNGVALTGGVVRVNYMGNRSHTISLGPRLRLSLMEVQLTMASGAVKRQTMVFAGTHALRAPLPIELVMFLGPLCTLALVCGAATMLRSGLRRAEPDAPPNGGPAEQFGNSGAPGGTPPVS
jgi:hypothetical protein